MIDRNHLVGALMFCLVFLGIAINASAQTCISDMMIPPTTPTSRFADNGDGTITDSKTGLMWAKCSEGLSGNGCTFGNPVEYNWLDALNLAEGKSLAGYGDWRLPNIKELQSIIERQCLKPAINLAVFPNTPNTHSWKSLSWAFWSASPTSGGFFTWYVSFDYGYAYEASRNCGMFVRLVRSGQ